MSAAPEATDPTGESPVAHAAKTSMTKRTLAGGAWLGAAAVLQVVMQFVVVGILARLLSPRDFGVVASATILIEIAQSMSQLGMGAAVVQKRNLQGDHVRVAFTVSVFNSIVLTTILFLLASPVANFLHTPDAAPILRALSFMFVIRAFGAISEGLVARALRFRILALRRTLGYFFGYGIVGVAAAWWGMGAWALVAAQLSQAACTTILLVLSARHSMRPLLRRDVLRDFGHFGSGLVAARIANTLALQSDYAVVARLLGPAALGIYSRTYQIMRLPSSLLGNVVEDLVFPGLAAVQHEPQRLRRGLLRGLLTMNLALFPAAAITLLLAPEIIYIALGAKWASAAPLLAMFAVAMPFRSTQRLCSTTARAVGATWSTAWREFVYWLAVIVGAAVGSRFGLPGVVVGVSLAIATQFLLHIQFAGRVMHAPLRALGMAHLRAAPLTIAVAIPVCLVAQLGERMGLGPVATLIAALAAAALVVLGAARIAPNLIITREGYDLIGAVLAKLPSRFGAVIGRALGAKAPART